MTSPVESPVGDYTDVTGVVDATAAAEIVVEIAKLTELIPDPSDTTDYAGSPDFANIWASAAQQLQDELAGLAAAIAAAPTS